MVKPNNEIRVWNIKWSGSPAAAAASSPRAYKFQSIYIVM